MHIGKPSLVLISADVHYMKVACTANFWRVRLLLSVSDRVDPHAKCMVIRQSGTGKVASPLATTMLSAVLVSD